jgi:hypothetical protein
MLPERAALVVIDIAHVLINLSFTTQLLGLCALASHFFTIEHITPSPQKGQQKTLCHFFLISATNQGSRKKMAKGFLLPFLGRGRDIYEVLSFSDCDCAALFAN